MRRPRQRAVTEFDRGTTGIEASRQRAGPDGAPLATRASLAPVATYSVSTVSAIVNGTKGSSLSLTVMLAACSDGASSSA